MWETIFATITIVPALAWFVHAFANLGKMYKKNEDKLKEVAKETANKVQEEAKEGAEKFKETVAQVEEKVEKKLYDEIKSTTEGGGN